MFTHVVCQEAWKGRRTESPKYGKPFAVKKTRQPQIQVDTEDSDRAVTIPLVAVWGNAAMALTSDTTVLTSDIAKTGQPK